MPKLVDPSRQRRHILATRLTDFEQELLRQSLEYHGLGPSDLVRYLVRREANRIQGSGTHKPKRKADTARKLRRKA